MEGKKYTQKKNKKKFKRGSKFGVGNIESKMTFSGTGSLDIFNFWNNLVALSTIHIFNHK